MGSKMNKKFDYEVIYDYLKNLIKMELKSNDKIPSENELCKLFNFTRVTIRQGINKLKSEGLIFSKQGSGYFVSAEKIHYTLSKFTTFSKEISKIGKIPSLRILEIKTINANNFLLEKFNKKTKLTLLKISLLRMVDDTPILIGTSYINLSLTPNIDEKIINTTSFTQLFEEYGLEPIRNHSDLEIISGSDYYMDLLQTQNRLPLIKISSTSVNKKSGEIIEYVESFFRSDLVKVSINFNQTMEVNIPEQ
jgi:DNA-binding GntR family transcriptional regulator